MATRAAADTLASVTQQLRAGGSVFAEDEARLLVAAAPTPAALADLVRRRVAGEPVEHVVGWAEFCGHRVAVAPGVFVPRRRTELLAREAAGLARTGAVVVDLCCGSGAVGLAVAEAVPGIELYAVDVDPVAVACARANLTPYGARVHEGDLFEPLPADLRGRVDVVVANVPYVPTAEVVLMPAEARLHEARVALDGGADGLDVLRQVAARAAGWLRPGGHLLVETSDRQAAAAVNAFAAGGLTARVARSGELAATVVLGTRHG